MVHDLLPFFIVIAVVCGGVLLVLFIDHLRAERAWKRRTIQSMIAMTPPSVRNGKGGAV